MKKVLIVAGEPSADLHGANLVKSINSRATDIEFIGVGGRCMKEAGVKIIFDADRIAVVGVSEVIRHLGVIRQAFKTAVNASIEEHIDLAVLIDFPDFNLRFAKRLYGMNIPIVYYISPQIWAWRKGRIRKIARYFKKVLVIFKFEEVFYKKAGVNAVFVGHPLIKEVKMSDSKEDLLKRYNIPAGCRIIALLPGSRTSEVRRHLPIMLKAARAIVDLHKDLFFVVPVLASQSEICRQIMDMYDLPAKLIVNDTYNAVGISDFAVAASGTATLEVALLGIPMIIVYKVSFLSHMVARMLVSINRIGIVNIATGEDIVPELVQNNLKSGKLAKTIDIYLKDKKAYDKMKAGYLKLMNVLGEMDASQKAAEEIITLLRAPV